MDIENIVLPKVKSVKTAPETVCCPLDKLVWIETEPEHTLAAEWINRALEKTGGKRREIVPPVNIGTRNRISLKLDPNLSAEHYRLTAGSDTIVIHGGSAAGVFYGAVTLTQIISASAHTGGNTPALPATMVEDGPRFAWRGLMLDSARHFQHVETIFALLDRMAEYKLNVFHWHFLDRQGWRPRFNAAPELADPLPPERCYSFGSYSRADLEAVRDYAQKRFIRVVPELEMPGHSAVVFRTHPDLACPVGDDPYGVDTWEYCLGNPDGKDFLKKLLLEILEIFPDSPVIHLGGDEAGTHNWKKCPRCLAAMKEKNLSDVRALEHAFMQEMSDFLEAQGRTPVTWGTPESTGFSEKMIIQDWLGNETLPSIRNGNRVISSVHTFNYFDYPAADAEPAADRQRIQYSFDPVPQETAEDEAKLIIGGEGCLWTEQIPEQRVLPRAVPRLRALSEILWADPAQKDFENFLLRERILIAGGLFPYC